MKVKTSKGFTLAELLIVMGIMVVLASIAIPTFGKQLETARETADAETIRACLEDAFNTAFTAYVNSGTIDKEVGYPSGGADITFTGVFPKERKKVRHGGSQYSI